MAVYQRGEVYWSSFVYNKHHYQESTGARSRKKAQDYEDDRRSTLRKEHDAKEKRAKELRCAVKDLERCAECDKLFMGAAPAVEGGQVFCSDHCEDAWRLRQSPIPTLAEFLKNNFLPFVEARHKGKPNTARYYQGGAADLLNYKELAETRINRITSQDASKFAARRSAVSASTVNCGLRTLRRALRLANDWGTIPGRPKIQLQPGEKQRERVLTDAEVQVYLNACEQPWRDCVIMLLGTGARPGEVFSLEWNRVQLNGSGGLLRIADGKSRAAKRQLPLVHAVYQILSTRWEAADKPTVGWVFPADTPSGHIEGGSAKNYHQRALAAIKAKAEEDKVENPVKPFPPYTMRHTALTRLGESGCDAFTLMRIAGHSSITLTQRYVHPQESAIAEAFKRGEKSLQVPGSLQFSLQSPNALPAPKQLTSCN